MAKQTLNPSPETHGDARNKINANFTELYDFNSGFGWVSFEDSTYTELSPLQLNAGNSYKAQLTNDGLASSITDQWPIGLALPWDTTTNKLVGTNDKDAFDFRLLFTAKDGGQPALVDAYIDIGGAKGIIYRSSHIIQKGASLHTIVGVSSFYFTGTTFLANGGTIYFDSSDTQDDLDIWDIKLFIKKSYNGR